MCSLSSHKIVIKAPNWLGDAVLFVPALKAIRLAFSGSEMCVVGNKTAGDVARLSGLAVDFVHFDRHFSGRSNSTRKMGSGARDAGGWRLIGETAADGRGTWRSALSALRRHSWDLGITFVDSFSSVLLLKLAGARHTVGYAGDSRGLLLSKALPRRRLGSRPHLVREYLALAETAGAAGAASADETPHLHVPQQISRAVREAFSKSGIDPEKPLVGLCPGAAFGPAKQWPADRFAAAGMELTKSGAAVVVFGAGSDADMAAQVATAVPGAISLAGKTSVMALAASLAECDVVVGNDSGASHLAAAVGAPVVAIFGSSDPAWTRPLGASVRVMAAGVPCAPCFDRRCKIGYACLERISVRDVVTAAMELAGWGLSQSLGV